MRLIQKYKLIVSLLGLFMSLGLPFMLVSSVDAVEDCGTGFTYISGKGCQATTTPSPLASPDCGDLENGCSTNCTYQGGGSNCLLPCCTDNNTDTSTCSTATGCVDVGESAASCSSMSCSFIGTYVNPAITLLSVIVGIVVVIAIIVGGIQFSTSGGDPKKAARGRKHVVNAIFGLIAYIVLYAFLQFIIPGGRLNG
jgi:hypothetical protein